MSIGFCLASCCTSVMCSASTFTVNSGTSRMCEMRSPLVRIVSTFSGQKSMKTISSPACAMCAPAYPPTAPVPTIAIRGRMIRPPGPLPPIVERQPTGINAARRAPSDGQPERPLHRLDVAAPVLGQPLLDLGRGTLVHRDEPDRELDPRRRSAHWRHSDGGKILLHVGPIERVRVGMRVMLDQQF